MSARLLLLEDDPAIARTVAYALERDGLTVTHSLLVHDARQQLQRARFDLLVLDVGLPDGSGLDPVSYTHLDVYKRQAAKGAIDTFTIGLAREVAAEGIRVNAVRPGLIETDIHASGGLPDRVRDRSHQVPMLRGGTADEVAEAIVWLMSPAASYTTATLMDVSGGR